MDFIYSAVLILVLFNAKKSDESDNENIIAMAGCNIYLTWILQDTGTNISFSIGRPIEDRIAARLADQNCDVRDNSSMLCSINSSDDGLIVVLNMFNVTARQSGNYTLWKKTALLEQSTYSSKKLVVIGKPNIMEVRKPILGLPFQMTCNTIYEQEDYLYRWIINDVEKTTVYNINSHIISSLSMNDNFSNVTCQVCLNETASNLSSVTCENDGCSIESNPYTIQVPYGPGNVSLNREERYFYLKENDTFAIECLADCYPKCLFTWKGRITKTSQNLTIIFESRLAGQYQCHVTNEQTNITLISDPIYLYLAKEDKELQDDNMGGFLSMGLVGVAVLLVVIGLLLVRQWRTIPSDKINSQVLTELVVNLQTLTNGDISQAISRIQNRPLPDTHEMSSRRRYSPRYLNQNRRSRSLHNLMDSTQDSFNPLRDGLSLQRLYSSSNIIERSLRNGTHANGPIKRRLLSNCPENQLDDMSWLENGNNLESLNAKVRKDKKTIKDEHTESETLNNLQQVTFEEEPQENLYSTID